jgi:CheY-like chemotaxis protein
VVEGRTTPFAALRDVPLCRLKTKNRRLIANKPGIPGTIVTACRDLTCRDIAIHLTIRPQTPPDSPMPTEFATLSQPQSAPDVVNRRHTVLIIDDDDTLSDVLSHRLKRQGLHTVAAYSGSAGLAKAKAAPPSAIVLDLGLPDADGLMICEQLADAPETCAVPILILSGREQPGLVRRCRAAGCHYFLRKPYDPNALLVLIRQAIRDVGRWQRGGFDGREG